MKWLKKGIIFGSKNFPSWAQTHAMLPTPIILNDSITRIYCTHLDKRGRGSIGYVDYNRNDFTKPIKVSDYPCMSYGDRGCFDQDGVVCCSVIAEPDGTIKMYYAGFELCKGIRYRIDC